MVKVSLQLGFLSVDSVFAISGYATASVEGRIAVEYFDPSPVAQDKKYAFKCHRQTINDVDHVWPVNSLAFHPVYNTFASAGSDGTISIWDHKVKKRLRQYPKFPGPVAAVAFNCDGSKIAVGVSYTWDEGEAGLKANPTTPWLGVRKVGDEVKVSRHTCSLMFCSYGFHNSQNHGQHEHIEDGMDVVLCSYCTQEYMCLGLPWSR